MSKKIFIQLGLKVSAQTARRFKAARDRTGLSGPKLLELALDVVEGNGTLESVSRARLSYEETLAAISKGSAKKQP